MVERRGPIPVKPGTRWQDRVEKQFWTVLLLPSKGHGDPRPIVVAINEDAQIQWFDLDYWYEDFEPAGKPQGDKYMLPATLPR